ncbi:hypothetical protein C8J57DRAFT_1379763 [Mycena rebaudengoi]|nr:hypothetical protein C8J57DRAFT_1379763 [Mycena rebaudengoi]
MRSMLAVLYGVPLEQLHVHHVLLNMDGLHELQAREVENGKPLSRADVDEILPNCVWIHEPGVHIGYRHQSDPANPMIIVLAVRIQAWGTMEELQKNKIQKTLQIIMDFSMDANPILQNSADMGQGFMYGMGWHASQEKNKVLVNYSMHSKDPNSVIEYEERIANLPMVAELYRERFSLLFPAAERQMGTLANQHGVAAFSDPLTGVDPQDLYTNSMTSTMNRFGNRQHRDKDLAPLAFGLWFPAKQIGAGKGPKRRQWGIRPDADHDKMSGGEFLWGAYGIGVDFQRASGLVDIFWRGQLDYHGTIDGTEPDGFTRFGTSVQITASGVRAMQKLWNVEELTACGHNVKLLDTGKKVTTIQDRANAAVRQHKKAKK